MACKEGVWVMPDKNPDASQM
jgi:hypothetical protein